MDPDNSGLKILSLNTTFSYHWLKDACTYAPYIHLSTQQKLHHTSNMAVFITPAVIETANDRVHISWSFPWPLCQNDFAAIQLKKFI